MRDQRHARPAHLRVLAKTEQVGDCWIWTGSTRGKGEHKYGCVMTGSRTDGTRRTRSTHTVVYEALVGPVPDGLELDHRCRNKLCCNPDHLEPVEHAENNARKPEDVRKRVSEAMLAGRAQSRSAA